MYSLSRIDGRIVRYEIRDDESGNYFRIAPERGGIVTEFNVGDRDILWMDWETFYDRSRYVWGGIPVLFPNCGLLENNTAVFNGKAYTIPIHGIVRNYPWQLTDTKADKDSGSITLRFSANENSLEQYPFHFNLDIRYTLKRNQLEIKVFCENTSPGPMPVHFGFHPYFTVTGKGESLEYETPCTRYLDLSDGLEKPFSGFPKLTNDRNSRILLDTRGEIAFRDPGRNMSVRMQSAKELPLYLIWAGDGEKFCIEPWSAKLNALNSGEGCIVIKPGNTLESGFTMEARQG